MKPGFFLPAACMVIALATNLALHQWSTAIAWGVALTWMCVAFMEER